MQGPILLFPGWCLYRYWSDPVNPLCVPGFLHAHAQRQRMINKQEENDHQQDPGAWEWPGYLPGRSSSVFGEVVKKDFSPPLLAQARLLSQSPIPSMTGEPLLAANATHERG